MKNLLVTGGCGFIGTGFIRYLLLDSDYDGRIINVDKLTYAGNLESLGSARDDPRHVFEQVVEVRIAVPLRVLARGPYRPVAHRCECIMTVGRIALERLAKQALDVGGQIAELEAFLGALDLDCIR